MDRPAPVRPATVRFEHARTDELRTRIRATRTARFPFRDRWYGTGSGVLAEILERWARFDPDELAARLNAIPQHDVDVDGVVIRAFHVRAERRDALPIVLTHGWPSTVLELPLAERLARPERHGADVADGFHVVVPALPGFPLSSAPAALDDYTADRWVALMGALGYERFVASAGDIGARVTDFTAAERAWLERRAAWDREEGGSEHLQQTKPLTLAHALAEQPGRRPARSVSRRASTWRPARTPASRHANTRNASTR